METNNYLAALRSVFIFSLFVFGVNIVSGQVGCKYNGDYTSILSKVKSLNSNAPTEEDRLTDTEAGKIAKYWELDCKCRKGVSTQKEAQQLANQAFLNTSNNFTTGWGVNERKKDLSYLGELKTPFAVFTPNDCLKGGGSFDANAEPTNNSNKLSKDDWMSLLNGIAEHSDNQIFRSLVNDFNQPKNGLSNMRQFTDLIAPSYFDNNLFNGLEKIGNVASIASAGFNLINSLIENSPRGQYKASQEEASRKIFNISSKLRLIFNEVVGFRPYKVFNEETLKDIATRKERLEVYKLYTAKQRLLIANYFFNKYDPLPTKEELENIINEIDKMSDEDAANEFDLLLKSPKIPILTSASSIYTDKVLRVLNRLEYICKVEIQFERTKSESLETPNTNSDKVKEILTNYINAIGGKEAIGKIKTMEVKSSSDSSEHISLSSLSPPRTYSITKTKSKKIGKKVIKGTQTEVLKLDNVIYTKSKFSKNKWEKSTAKNIQQNTYIRELEWLESGSYKNFPCMSKKAEVKGQKCYIILRPYSDGLDDIYTLNNILSYGYERLYYNTNTGLLMKQEIVSITVGLGEYGTASVGIYETLYSDYKKVEGVSFPHITNYLVKTETNNPNYQSQTIYSYKVNIALNESLFKID